MCKCVCRCVCKCVCVQVCVCAGVCVQVCVHMCEMCVQHTVRRVHVLAVGVVSLFSILHPCREDSVVSHGFVPLHSHLFCCPAVLLVLKVMSGRCM